MLFKNKNDSQKLYLSMSLAFVIVALTFIIYTFCNGKQIRANNHEYLVNDTKQSATNISHVIKEGYSNIKILSELVSESLTSPEVDVANYQKLIKDSVFDFVEFADRDGNDHNITGGISDASDRQYYLDAMNGNSGLEVLYNSRATHENLLDFYSPVYYENEVVGSLIGVYQASNRITEILTIDYFGEDATSYLCDTNGKVFASSEALDFSVEHNITDYIDTDSKNTKKIRKGLLNQENTSFFVDGNKASGYITKVQGTDWMLVSIYPSIVNARMIQRTGIIALLMVVAILICFVAQQLTVSYLYRKQEKKTIDQLTILQSVADIYYSMHLIDMKTLSVTEYKSNEMLRNVLSTGNHAISMMEKVVDATITDEFLDAAHEFSDVTTLSERLRNKQFIFMDLLGKNVGWIRMTFIKIASDKEGMPTKIVIAIQVIDEEKRREIELLYKSNNDEMTGLYNRRAYDEDAVKIGKNPERMSNLYIISADVNGLKAINDNMGHAAGDEVIQGAAKCLKNAFGKLGKVYRTGGDEFMALLFAEKSKIDKAIKVMNELSNSWQGEIVKELHISYACIAHCDYKELDFHELEMKADSEMYKVKSQYYIDNKIDRRRS